MNTSEVLNRAADLIEERGWAQGNCGMAVTGPTCLEGAIAAVLGAETAIWDGGPWEGDPEPGDEYYRYCPDLNKSPAYKAVQAHLQTTDSLYVFNDNADEADEVIATLRAAAVIEAKENTDVREPVTA